MKLFKKIKRKILTKKRNKYFDDPKIKENYKGKLLIVYIKFNGENVIWDNMIDHSSKEYGKLPVKVDEMKEEINENDFLVPIYLRTFYACREFDFLGFFKEKDDQEKIIKILEKYKEELDFKYSTFYGKKINLIIYEDHYKTVHSCFDPNIIKTIRKTK